MRPAGLIRAEADGADRGSIALTNDDLAVVLEQYSTNETISAEYCSEARDLRLRHPCPHGHHRAAVALARTVRMSSRPGTVPITSASGVPTHAGWRNHNDHYPESRRPTPPAAAVDPGVKIVAMPARISCVCIDAVAPRPVADFWAAVLGWEVLEEDDDGISLAPPGGGLPTLDVLRVPEVKQMKNRLHLDLRADGTSFDAELDRLEGLGARRVDVGQGRDVTWVVFADPEGNEFCLLRRTVQEAMPDLA